jgi:ferredoxin
MIVTERKDISEILGFTDGEQATLVVACGGCPEGCESGTPQELDRLRGELEAAGRRVVDVVRIDFLCNKPLVARRLMASLDAMEQADSLLVSSCGIGVQAVAATVEKATHPVMNTLSMGGFQGLWPSDERCEECGECVLSWTGGICPRTACTKSLVNGTCGGTMADGTCEISRDIPCGWRMIYDRLAGLGRLERLYHFVAPPDFHKLKGNTAHRKTTWWAAENPEIGQQPSQEETAQESK